MKLTTRIAVALAAALFSLESATSPSLAQTVLRSQTVSFDNYAALEAVPFARFQAGAAVIVAEAGRGGTFIKVTSDESALANATTGDADKCVFIPSPQDTDGSSGGWLRKEYQVNRKVGIDPTWCGAAGNGTTDDSAKINNVIDAVNSGVFAGIALENKFRIADGAPLTTITADGFFLRGKSKATGFVKAATATNAEFLKFGGAGDPAVGFTVDDIVLEVNASASVGADDFALETVWANSCRISNIWGSKLASVVKLTRAGLCNFENWTTDVDNGANAAANIMLLDVAVIKFENVSLSTTTVTANTNATGKCVLLQTTPSSSGSIDTIWFDRFGCQIYNSADLTKSKPYGFYVDRVNLSGNSSVTNIFFQDSYIDHTSVAAVLDNDGVNSGSDTRLWHFSNFRFATDAGVGIDLRNNAFPASVAQDRANMSFANGMIIIQDDSPAFKVAGNRYRNGQFVNNMIAYRNAVSKTKAVSIDADGWTVAGITIAPDLGSSALGFDVAVQIEDEALSEVNIGKIFAPASVELIREPIGVDNASIERAVERRGFNYCQDPRRKMCSFIDFLNSSSVQPWVGIEGTDAAATSSPLAFQTGNVMNGSGVQTSGNNATRTMAVNGVQSTYTSTNFHPFVGGLRLEARVRTNNTSAWTFIGFTDSVSLEDPITLSGTTLTSNATDACGFLFDPNATAANIHLVGVKADVDATRVDTGIAYSTTTKIYEMEIDDTGAARFWVNGALAGTVANCVTSSAGLTPGLTPYIGLNARSSSTTQTIDYTLVEQDRY